jgi:hypothetical protein
VEAAVSAGYLDDSRPDWEQPEDRMIWKLRSYFSNDQIASLVRPGSLATPRDIDAGAMAWLAGKLN